MLAHVLSGILAGGCRGAGRGAARLCPADHRRRLAALSFAAPIIGGAALTGGYISVLGTMFAVVLIALIENGMVLARVDPYWVQFLLGALILAAVWLNRWRAVRTGTA